MIQNRKLLPPEQAMEILNQHSGCFGIATVSHIKGQLKGETLRQSLNLVQQRYPRLNCRIVGSVNSLYFQAEGNQAIPLKIIQHSENKSWQDIVFHNFNTPLGQDQGLIKCLLIKSLSSGDSYYFITIIHHGIADGLSTVRLHNAIFDYYEKIDKNLPIDEVVSLPIIPSINQLFPWYGRGCLGLIHSTLLLLKQKLQEQIYQVKKFIPEQTVPTQLRRGNFIHRCLDETLTKKILGQCKQEKTTVQGALCAALLLTILPELQRNKLKDISVSCHSYVDLRQRFTPVISDEHMEVMISFLVSFHRLKPQMKFWDLARDVSQQLQRGLRRGDFFKYPMMFKKIVEYSLANPRQVSPTVSVTNIGQVKMPNRYGDLEIENICFVPNVALFSDSISLAASTFRNKMTLNFLFSHPSISQETITRIANGMIEGLSVVVS